MDEIRAAIQRTAELVWGWPLMAFLAGTGLWLTVRLRGLQFRRLGAALGMVVGGSRRQGRQGPGGEGDISDFQALMTALSATVGTGNIAGVATAIATGGPGALFWMWIMGLIGMATKYAEAVLAVHYRVKDPRGEMCGGPMYYLSRGLGWRFLAGAFAVFTVVSSVIGIGCMVQSNSIASAMRSAFHVPEVVTGVALALATGAVLLFGIKAIGRVAGVVVPVMILAFGGAALAILVARATEIPHALGLVFAGAFTPTAAAGGFAGAAVREAMRMGISRGLFSNESGLGSAPIAAAAAQTPHPGHQALISMTQTFLDTLVVNTLCGLAILVSGAWTSGLTSAALTTEAFARVLPGGQYVVAVSLLLFAWTTILGWSYYGERALEYLVGLRGVKPYRLFFVLVVAVGAVARVEIAWAIGDIFNGLMAVPNLLALLALSGVVVRLSREYEDEVGPRLRRAQGR